MESIGGNNIEREHFMQKKGERYKRLQRVLELHEQNASVEEMAEDLGVTTNAVYSYIAELGLKKKKYYEAQKKVLELYLAGEKISEISKSLDVSVGFIHKEIKAAGLKPRREFVVIEPDLINENTVFADNEVKIEILVVNGKRYQDVTQIFGGR